MAITWFRKKAPLIEENRLYFASFDRKKPLDEYTFVVFDTELTGLDRRNDEIISLGAVTIENLQIDLSRTFYQQVQPRGTAHTDATLVHRLTPEDLKEAPPLEDVVPEFLDFLGKSLIVGHCIGIDMDFLGRACRNLYGGTLANPTIDTMQLSQGYQRLQSGRFNDYHIRKDSFNLRELSKKFDLPVFEQHNALEDAIQTAYLFLYLVKKMRSGGLGTLGHIYQASRTSDWGGEP